jgi:IS30 family transposase|tara:strand:+ start:3261 stop:3584 length:324 start_codon:yes stop_codon:yes gene_type:complete
MGKPVVVTPCDIEYLTDALKDELPYTQMARRLGICVDTVKRILQREGLRDFDGAKYVVALSSARNVKMWERPCIRCRDEQPRPKWQFMCKKCTEYNEQHGTVLGDDW